LEVACGTGRLLYRLAQNGYEVSGIDLSPEAVSYCNARFERLRIQSSVQVADMQYLDAGIQHDAILCTLNGIRHLESEQAVVKHLNSLARGLKTGGLYIVSLELTPVDFPIQKKSFFIVRQDSLVIVCKMLDRRVDFSRRIETRLLEFEIGSEGHRTVLKDEMNLITFTAAQFYQLMEQVPQLSLVETFDTGFSIQDPIDIDGSSEEVVFVFRKT
jgi:SAM-dependent methyltransferase